MAWRLHNRSWRDGGGRSCRAETQRVTQPDTPLSTGPSAPAGGAVVPSLGTPQLKSCTTGSCPQSRARLFLRRGGEGPRGRHALPVGKPTSTNLLRRTPNWQCSQTPSAPPRTPYAPHTFVMLSHRASPVRAISPRGDLVQRVRLPPLLAWYACLLAQGGYRGWCFRRLDRAGSMQF